MATSKSEEGARTPVTLPRSTLRWVADVLAQPTTRDTWKQQLEALRFLGRIGSAADVHMAEEEVATLQQTQDDALARLAGRQGELAQARAQIVEWRQKMAAKAALEALGREKAAARAEELAQREEEISRDLQHEHELVVHRKAAEGGRIAAVIHTLEAELATITSKTKELNELQARGDQVQRDLEALVEQLAAMHAEDDVDAAELARVRAAARLIAAEKRQKSMEFDRLRDHYDADELDRKAKRSSLADRLNALKGQEHAFDGELAALEADAERLAGQKKRLDHKIEAQEACEKSQQPELAELRRRKRTIEKGFRPPEVARKELSLLQQEGEDTRKAIADCEAELATIQKALKDMSNQDMKLVEVEADLAAEKHRVEMLEESRIGTIEAQKRAREILADARKSQGEGNKDAAKLRRELENSRLLLEAARGKTGDQLRALGLASPGKGVNAVRSKLEEYARELHAIAGPLADRTARVENLRAEHSRLSSKVRSEPSRPHLESELARFRQAHTSDESKLADVEEELANVRRHTEEEQSLSDGILEAQTKLSARQRSRDQLQNLEDEAQVEMQQLVDGIAAARADAAAEQAEAELLKTKLDAALAPIKPRQAKVEQQIIEGNRMRAKAQEAVEAIDKLDLEELRSMPHPPSGVELVLEAVMLIIGKRVVLKGERGMSSDLRAAAAWKQIRKQLQDHHFLLDVLQLDSATIPKKTVKLLKGRHFLANPAFVEEKIAHASLAAGPLCGWLRAMCFLVEALIAEKELAADMHEIRESLSSQFEEYDEKMRQIDLDGAPKVIAELKQQLQAMETASAARVAEIAKLDDRIQTEQNDLASLQTKRKSVSAKLAELRPEAVVAEAREVLQHRLQELEANIQQYEKRCDSTTALEDSLAVLAQQLADAEAQLADKTSRKSVLEKADVVAQVLLDEELQHHAKRNQVEAALEAIGCSGDSSGKVIADTEAVLRKLKHTLDKSNIEMKHLEASLANIKARCEVEKADAQRLRGIANRMRPEEAVEADLNALKRALDETDVAVGEQQHELDQLVLQAEKRATVDKEIEALADTIKATHGDTEKLRTENTRCVGEQQRLDREIREKTRSIERLQNQQARLRDDIVQHDASTEAAQQAFLESTAEHELASAALDTKIDDLENRTQDLQDGVCARGEQTQALEGVQQSMALNLEGNREDCTHTTKELSALRPQAHVEADLLQKQLELQRLQDQLDSDASGTRSLILDRAGLEIVLHDIADDLATVGLENTTADTVFNSLGVQDEHITFDQFESWFHNAVRQQKRQVHNAAADMHDDAVHQRENTLAQLERTAEQLNEDVADSRRVIHATEMALHHASARTSVAMKLNDKQLAQLASWVRITSSPLLVRMIEQSRPKLRKEAAHVISKLAVALGALADWHRSLDFLLPPLIGCVDPEAALSVATVFRVLSNSSLRRGSRCFGHLVTQCTECITGCGGWCRTLKGPQGTLVVLTLLHRLLHQAIGGELDVGGVTSLLKHCVNIKNCMIACMNTTHGGRDQEVKDLAEQALEYLQKLAASCTTSHGCPDACVQTESMRASEYALKTLSDSVFGSNRSTSGQSHRRGKKREMIHVDRTLLQALMHGHRTLFGHNVANKDELFDTMDGDGSAGLSDLEFAKAMKRLDLGLSPAALEALFDQLDGNHNNQLGFREFEAVFRQQRRTNSNPAKLSKDDRNGENIVDGGSAIDGGGEADQGKQDVTPAQLLRSLDHENIVEGLDPGTPANHISVKVFNPDHVHNGSALRQDQQLYLERVARQSSERKQRRASELLLANIVSGGTDYHCDFDSLIS